MIKNYKEPLIKSLNMKSAVQTGIRESKWTQCGFHSQACKSPEEQNQPEQQSCEIRGKQG